MAWVNVAIAAGTALSAGASIYGSGQAANASAAGSKQAIGEQRRQFDTITGLQQPYYQTGVGALNLMSALYGLPAQQPYNAAMQPITVAGHKAKKGGLFGGRIPEPPYNDAAGIFGSDRNKSYGATIDPVTGTVSGTGNPEADAGYTQYLRTGTGGGKGAVGNDIRAAIDKLRGSGWKYDPNAAQTAQAGQPSQASVLEQFRQMPGYQFGMKEGTTAVEQGAAARSGVLGGNALRNVMSFGQDYAGTKLGEEWNRLAGLAGIGQQSANVQSNAAQNTANQNSNYMQNAGDARASGILGQYNGAANSINSGLNNWMRYRGGWFGA